MYEQYINDMSSLFGKKREEAIKHLSEEMKKNPRKEELFRPLSFGEIISVLYNPDFFAKGLFTSTPYARVDTEYMLMITEFVVISIEVVVLIVLYHHMRSLRKHTIVLEEHIFHMEKSLDELDRKLKGHYEAVSGMFDDIDRVVDKAHERAGKGK